METFPTLSRNPTWGDYQQSRAYDPTIRAKSEGGYVKTRARYTRAPKKFTAIYNYLTSTEKASLETFEDTVGVGADAFTWSDPDAVSHTVRLAEAIIFTRVTQGTGRWKAEMTLEEV